MAGSRTPLFDGDEIERVLRRAKHHRWRTTARLIAGARSRVSRSIMRAGRKHAAFVGAVVVLLTSAPQAAFG